MLHQHDCWPELSASRICGFFQQGTEVLLWMILTEGFSWSWNQTCLLCLLYRLCRPTKLFSHKLFKHSRESISKILVVQPTVQASKKAKTVYVNTYHCMFCSYFKLLFSEWGMLRYNQERILTPNLNLYLWIITDFRITKTS